MKKLSWVGFSSAALLGLALAQGNGGFTVISTPGLPNQIATTETFSNRAALLQLKCVGTQIEVSLDPKVKLTTTQTPTVSVRFDDAPALQQQWNFAPEGGELLLPQNFTQQFIAGITDAKQARIVIPEQQNPSWEGNFNVMGFRAAYAQLPCNTAIALTTSANPPTPTPIPTTTTKVIDPTIAFIAPLEFSKAFGGRFEPEAGKLAWEYNGIKLILEQNKTLVRNVSRNTSLELPRAVRTMPNGRTVVPARVVAAFNCNTAPTKPTDAIVRVTCGGGTTQMTRDLPRY